MRFSSGAGIRRRGQRATSSDSEFGARATARVRGTTLRTTQGIKKTGGINSKLSCHYTLAPGVDVATND